MTEESTTQDGDIAVAVRTAQAAAEPHPLAIDEQYSVVVPEGARLQIVDLVKYQERPPRLLGESKAATVESFVDLVKLHEGDSTTIWIDLAGTPAIVAVFNDNAAESGWGDHRVTLALQVTDEWKHWSSRDGVQMDQEAFAEHLEDGVQEIVKPDAATMLEIAQSIHATVNATIRSGKRLDNGSVQVQYDEEIDGSAGQSGELEIPQEFELAIAPFLGEDTYKVMARLRYRINRGKVTLGYRLERPDAIVVDALERIKEKLDGDFERVFMGVPAAKRS